MYSQLCYGCRYLETLTKDIAGNHLCTLYGRHWLYELALVYWVPVETDYTPYALGSDTVYSSTKHTTDSGIASRVSDDGSVFFSLVADAVYIFSLVV